MHNFPCEFEKGMTGLNHFQLKITSDKGMCKMSSLLTGIAACLSLCCRRAANSRSRPEIMSPEKKGSQRDGFGGEAAEIFFSSTVFRCHMCYKLGRCFRSGSPFKISFAIQRRAKLCSCREAAAAQRPPARCVSFLTTPLLYGTSLLETQNSK